MIPLRRSRSFDRGRFHIGPKVGPVTGGYRIRPYNEGLGRLACLPMRLGGEFRLSHAFPFEGKVARRAG